MMKRRQPWRKCWAWTLVVAMLLSLLPSGALWAAPASLSVTDSNGTIAGSANNTNYTIDYALDTENEAVTVSGTSEKARFLVTKDTTMTLDGANVTLDECKGSPIEVTDGAHLTLILKGENHLMAYSDGPGILVDNDASLTIRATNGEADSLTVAGADLEGYIEPDDPVEMPSSISSGFAGIGGPNGNSAYTYTGTITIEGGTINATGYGYGAGIGGGDYGSGGTINISGGIVTAINDGDDPNGWESSSVKQASGIGGSQGQDGGTITISGDAKVSAYGGVASAGIGGAPCKVTIQGTAEVEAYGGDNAAGIGGYDKNKGDSTIAILDTATVEAHGGRNASGIGQGAATSNVTLTIAQGATVVAYSDGQKAAITGTAVSADSAPILNLVLADNVTLPTGDIEWTVEDSVTSHTGTLPEGMRALAITANGPCSVSVKQGGMTIPLYGVDGNPVATNKYDKAVTVAPLRVPSAPTGITAVAGDGKIDVSWKAPTDHGGAAITGYKVYYNTKESLDDAKMMTVNADTTRATIDGLENNQEYYITVVAVNAVGDSTMADIVHCMVFAPGNVVEVRNAKQLAAALANDAVTDIQVADSFSYSASIPEKKQIAVKAGQTLTLEYSTAFYLPYNATFCNADLTVENGAQVVFHDTAYWADNASFPAWRHDGKLHSYFIMNGAFTLREGAEASTARDSAVKGSGYLLFRGNFANSGTFDAENIALYVNHGTAPGTVTNGQAKENLCLTAPKNLQAPQNSEAIKALDIGLTGIDGDAYVGGTLRAVADGFGPVSEEGLFPVQWNGNTASAQYTVPEAFAGQTVSASLNGNLGADYGYFYVAEVDGNYRAYQLTTFDSAVQSVTIADFVVTLNANGGQCDEVTLVPNQDGKLESLPTPSRDGYLFDGWYTRASGGDKVTVDTVFDKNTTIYAHWQSIGGGGTVTYPPIIEKTENGTVTVTPKSPRYGDTVQVTAAADDGYVVGEAAVYDKDGNALALTDLGDGRYSFIQPRGKVTIKVTFKPRGCDGGDTCPSKNYTDLDPIRWYHDAVDEALRQGLMVGTTATTFEPQGITTRGMIVSILHRLAGKPAVEEAAYFEDVAAGAWYAEAVNWAAANGIVSGYDQAHFGPNDAITREQLAAILRNYAAFSGLDVSASADVSDFSDAAQISAWAETAMQWAYAEGLLVGNDNKLSPQGHAVRCQAAAVMVRFVEDAEK